MEVQKSKARTPQLCHSCLWSPALEVSSQQRSAWEPEDESDWSQNPQEPEYWQPREASVSARINSQEPSDKCVPYLCAVIAFPIDLAPRLKRWKTNWICGPVISRGCYCWLLRLPPHAPLSPSIFILPNAPLRSLLSHTPLRWHQHIRFIQQWLSTYCMPHVLDIQRWKNHSQGLKVSSEVIHQGLKTINSQDARGVLRVESWLWF